jgi:flagellar hook-associated protein 3 FlgL
MRISTEQMWRVSLADVQQATHRQTQAQETITSGQRINRVSDDPTAADRSIELNAAAEAIDQYKRAGEDAVSFMNAQDRTLQTMLDRMGRVEELTIMVTNDTITAEAREVVALEIEELQRDLVQLANSKHGDRSLFGGFQDAAIDASGASVSLVADTGEIMRRIAKDQVMQVNVEAAEVFGFSAGRNLFDVVNDIVLDARNANLSSLTDLRLVELEALRQSVSNGLGLVGTRTQRVETTLEDLSVEHDQLDADVSELVDADIVKASVELSEASFAYEAALAATARINQVSLLNYL